MTAAPIASLLVSVTLPPRPEQLGKLTKMTDDFGLSHNKLTGTIPDALGKLTKLSNDFEINNNSASRQNLIEDAKLGCHEWECWS